MAATLTAARNLRSETFTESPGVFNFGSAGKPRPQVGLALHHLLPCVELVGIVGRRPEADLRPLPGQMSRALLCRHPITTGAGGKAVHALLSGRRRLNSSIQTVVRPAGVWPSMQAPSRPRTSAPAKTGPSPNPGAGRRGRRFVFSDQLPSRLERGLQAASPSALSASQGFRRVLGIIPRGSGVNAALLSPAQLIG